MLDFLASYGLLPEDMPKADTLKILTKEEIEAAKEKAIKDAERAENDRKAYKRFLELKWTSRNDLKKQEIQEKIEESMRLYENSSDSERRKLLNNEVRGQFEQRVTPDKDVKTEKKKSKQTNHIFA